MYLSLEKLVISVAKEIIWEKWNDPLFGNVTKVVNSSSDEEEQFGEDLFSEISDEFDIGSSKLIHTPLGLYSISDEALLCEKFNFWLMHTNFDITEKIVDIISKISGVETLDVYSRYRLRIGIPMTGLFEASKVRKEINDKVKKHENEASNTILDKMINFNSED